jgi:hypothetical protein
MMVDTCGGGTAYPTVAHWFFVLCILFHSFLLGGGSWSCFWIISFMCNVFLDLCLSFSPFSFYHCIVCPTSIDDFWLSLFCLLFFLNLLLPNLSNITTSVNSIYGDLKIKVSSPRLTKWQERGCTWCRKLPISTGVRVRVMVFNATFDNTSVIVAVSFIGGGNRIEYPENTNDLSQVTDKRYHTSIYYETYDLECRMVHY